MGANRELAIKRFRKHANGYDATTHRGEPVRKQAWELWERIVATPSSMSLAARVWRASVPCWKITSPTCGYVQLCRVHAMSQSVLIWVTRYDSFGTPPARGEGCTEAICRN